MPSVIRLARLTTTIALLSLIGCTSTSSELSSSKQAPPHSDLADGGPRGNVGVGEDRPRAPVKWVVTMGDSFISGEGARWAGNTTGPASSVDVGGDKFYFDSKGMESQAGCSRVTLTDEDLGPERRHKNLACSGATTVSTGRGSAFKPGLDFYHGGNGHIGQARALQRFAGSHHVTDVVVSIGGNDFGFASVLTRCISAFVTTVGAQPSYCRDDPQVAGQFDAKSADLVSRDISRALRRTARAMRKAGYRSTDYTIVVQNYASPLSPGPLRYPETLAERYTRGGCPVYDEDATWAHGTALPVINGAVAAGVDRTGRRNIVLLDVSAALEGHRLCERGVTQVGPGGLRSWQQSDAAARLEWVNRLYLAAQPWRIGESWHPNHWGVAALRHCMRQATQREPTASWRCVAAGKSAGEPLTRLHAP